MVIINKKIGLTILCLLMIITGCATKNSKDKKVQVAFLKPKEVIGEFYKYYNQKNLKGMNTLTIEKYHSSESSWGFDNLEYIKVINIIEDTDQTNKEVYLRQMKKSQIIDMEKEKLELENVAIFKVDFETKYKKDGVGPSDSGRDEYSYTLTRKDKNSPWLISSFGH
ncbi:DUF4829 domain-containing protein [Clostridium tagluense]|uniref:DUF4829 domain-containing protein n=2 Tax=Clostridium tagluense TaxID=360422 RepID=UPI001CF3E531|nr:DUF4829 domain-containing protein [Clostridium tagluense]MCB2312799.1 DUF4829 domain-containing protein [Clostridium tagluense]MCB2317565.1 DUF4829 domain-containing protein [Clostridium tagluense]MCB2327348.1 DUF4829 domain-containing protein [Clostridium tagluense]MCB2332067.1 DUF4829 domain-containing protein [Clostridium tagluense]WAG52858.1 DUF4829 domain-containing protein [Clostridium tagluense]